MTNKFADHDKKDQSLTPVRDPQSTKESLSKSRSLSGLEYPRHPCSPSYVYMLTWDLYLDSMMTSHTLPVQASHLPRLVMLLGSLVQANFDEVLLLIEKQLPAWWW